MVEVDSPRGVPSATPTTVLDMAVPMIANRYAVQRQLGAGRADVYEVIDTHEGDVVALKLLRRIAPGAVWNEARILRRLSDAHILPIRNADLASGQPYIVTELAQHGTLADRLAASGARGLRSTTSSG